MLGEFEYLVISAAVRRGENSYGAAIREETSKPRSGRAPSAHSTRPSTASNRRASSRRGWAKLRPSVAGGPSGWSVSPAGASGKRPLSIGP